MKILPERMESERQTEARIVERDTEVRLKGERERKRESERVKNWK